MDYQLVIVRGRSAAQALQLADGVTTVGRHDECQLRIKSSQVSRKHCELFERKGLLLVKDLGSANGTYVNGKKVDGQRVLEAGDELTIGAVTLRVEKKSEPGAAVPAAAPAASKPSDTAVAAAEAGAGAAPAPLDDEFEIDFDSEPAAFTEAPAAVADDLTGDAELDALLNEPVPSAAPTPTPAPSSSKKPPAEEPAAAAEPEQGLADDAVADFLLDIKFDDDDR